MKSSVEAAFRAFSSRFEGAVNFMYLDVKGLVTTGIGNLIDPGGVAMALPWLKPDGTPASRGEIASEWANVKSRDDLKLRGGMIYKTITKLRLSDEGVTNLLLGVLHLNNAALVKRFPDFEDWPADAQLATHSMAWACGTGFRFPKLAAALLAADFRVAATECHMNTAGNPGLIPRNAANEVLYRNAAVTRDLHLDPDHLCWPTDMDLAVLKDAEAPDRIAEPEDILVLHQMPNMLEAYMCMRDEDGDPDCKG